MFLQCLGARQTSFPFDIDTGGLDDFKRRLGNFRADAITWISVILCFTEKLLPSSGQMNARYRLQVRLYIITGRISWLPCGLNRSAR